MKNCTNCNAAVEDFAAFCPYCGLPIEKVEATPVAEPVTEAPATEEISVEQQPVITTEAPVVAEEPVPSVATQPATEVPQSGEIASEPTTEAPVAEIPTANPITETPITPPVYGQTPPPPPPYFQTPPAPSYNPNPQPGNIPPAYMPGTLKPMLGIRPSTSGMMTWAVIITVLGGLGICLFGILGIATLVMGIIALVQINGANKAYYEHEFYSKLRTAKILNIISTVLIGIGALLLIILVAVAATLELNASDWYTYY